METEVEQLIEDCMNRESKLTQWEANFIQSISEQLKRKPSLSQKQTEILKKIWERVT
jgi:hypothetical protein